MFYTNTCSPVKPLRSPGSVALESAVDRDLSVTPEDVRPREAGVCDQAELVGQRDVEVLLGPLAEVSFCLRGGDPVSRHVREQVLDHPSALGAVGVDERVGDDDEAARLERIPDCSIELALRGVRGDVMQSKRGDYGVTAGKLVLEAGVPHTEAPGVRRAPFRRDLEHVRVDVDELDADLG